MNHPEKQFFTLSSPTHFKIPGKQICKLKLPMDFFSFCNQLLFNVASEVSLILAALQGSYFHAHEPFMAISPIDLTQTSFSLILE